MINWQSIAATVGAAFTRAGCATIGFCRPTHTVNVAAGTDTQGTLTFSPVRGFILPASGGTVEAFDNRRESDALKGVELRYVKLAACDLPSTTPRQGDLLQFSGKNWYVLGCTPVDVVGSVSLVYGIGVHAL
jgi:hypothetical protein